MTNPRNRQQDRAMRAFKRANPHLKREQVREAVAARAGQQSLPDRTPGVPLPDPAERLEGYVRRTAAAAGVQLHRAMELLGLQPGTSATERLDQLAGGLPDHTVQALVAATGMTPGQARALTAPLQRPDLETVRRITEANFAHGSYRRGSGLKTSTSLLTALTLAQRAGMIDIDSPGPEPEQELEGVARLLAEASGPRPLLIDLPANEILSRHRPALVDLDWPSNATRWPPVDPEVFDDVAQALGLGKFTASDAPQPE
ncbi:hypothetical protein ACIOG4_38835 [Streptomyces microflavus]|uniref:hypothetical protein n=1 Tax=Streptomyces microflavus TaxID=1919 RepID=UPI0037F85C62